MPPLVPNTIGYLLDLDGPRGDIIKRVTNLQLHRGIGDSLWARDQGDRPPSVRIYRSQLLFWGTFCSYRTVLHKDLASRKRRSEASLPARWLLPELELTLFPEREIFMQHPPGHPAHGRFRGRQRH